MKTTASLLLILLAILLAACQAEVPQATVAPEPTVATSAGPVETASPEVLEAVEHGRPREGIEVLEHHEPDGVGGDDEKADQRHAGRLGRSARARGLAGAGAYAQEQQHRHREGEHAQQDRRSLEQGAISDSAMVYQGTIQPRPLPARVPESAATPKGTRQVARRSLRSGSASTQPDR